MDRECILDKMNMMKRFDIEILIEYWQHLYVYTRTCIAST